VAERFSPSAHLRVDDLREIMVNGFAAPGEWTSAAEQQFRRARLVATQIARLHVADGVTLLIDDVCVPRHFEDHYRELFTDPTTRRVMLNPSMSALEERVLARGGPWDEALLTSGAIAWCYEGLQGRAFDGRVVIDSSRQVAEETVESVLHAVTRPASGG
jgi:hypothetical protein